MTGGDDRLQAFLDKLDYTDDHATVSKAVDAALYAFAVTVKNPTLRRVFVQDLAAALGRRKIMPNDEATTERFWQLAEDRINNINMAARVDLLEAVTT